MSNAIPPFSPSSTPSSSSSDPRRVAYFYDPDVGNYVYYLGHFMKPHRIRMAHNLIVNYGLCDDMSDATEPGEASRPIDGTRHMNSDIVSGWEPNGDGERGRTEGLSGARGKSMQVFRPHRATKGDMTRFHSDEYIDFLERVTPETADMLTGGGQRCLVGEDCPAFEGLFEFCSISAGGSLGAAEKLNNGAADIAINWAGGLHHAKKSEASGFCYVNDIVLGILELLRIHPRVLYIDVDVHHGDGVEEAFYTTDRVMTASFHRFGDFFPGTGDVKDIGMKRGKGYSVNVPLRDGITDDSFHSIFKPVISHIMEFFRPGAVVLQMGADSLSGDKLGGFNLTLNGHAECASYLKSFNIPVMMLGGGGYTTKNVARAWTNETAVMCGIELHEDLPYNQYMEYYGPRFKLEVLPHNTDDHNPPEYLEAMKRRILENLRNLPHAPGVQMQQVPTKRVARELGMKNGDESDPEDEVESRLRKLMRRKQMNGTYSPPDSDEDSEDDVSRRGSLQQRGGPSRRVQRLQQRASPSNSSLMDDDPCGVRHKRTFFRSNHGGDTTSLRKQLGLSTIVANGLNRSEMPEAFSLAGLKASEDAREGMSRGGSPASVVT